MAVGVVLDKRLPRVVLSSFLATAAEDDRLSQEPYRIAYELAADAKSLTEAAAAVAEGRRRQDAFAAKNLSEILRQIADAGFEPPLAALLINRAGWVSDLVTYALEFPDHVPVAEGLGVREALRAACKAAKLKVSEMDEASLPELAATLFGSDELDARLKAFGQTAGRPWRKEQKLASMAAWVALSL